MPWETISSGCSGRFGLASLPWMPPVSAQVMITLAVGSLISVLSFTRERRGMVHHVANSFTKVGSSLPFDFALGPEGTPAQGSLRTNGGMVRSHMFVVFTLYKRKNGKRGNGK